MIAKYVVVGAAVAALAFALPAEAQVKGVKSGQSPRAIGPKQDDPRAIGPKQDDPKQMGNKAIKGKYDPDDKRGIIVQGGKSKKKKK